MKFNLLFSKTEFPNSMENSDRATQGIACLKSLTKWKNPGGGVPVGSKSEARNDVGIAAWCNLRGDGFPKDKAEKF